MVSVPLLHAEGVSKSFGGVPALRDGRLTLERGSVHALCGGNGAGKSTFLSVIMGLLRRDGGTIQVNGHPVDFASPAQALASGLAIITQELSPICGMPWNDGQDKVCNVPWTPITLQNADTLLKDRQK